MDKSCSCHVLINALSEPGPQFRFTLQERVNVVAAGSGLRAILARPFEDRCSRMRWTVSADCAAPIVAATWSAVCGVLESAVSAFACRLRTTAAAFFPA